MVVFYVPISGQSKSASTSDNVVQLKSIEFMPLNIKADLGDEINFINNDPFEHDVYIVRTANKNVILVPPSKIQPGESLNITIDEKGLYTVYCTIHGGMSAKLTTTGSFELTEEEKLAASKAKVSLPPIAKKGEELFWNNAQCFQCHKIGDRGQGERGPNLADIGMRSRFRANELGLSSGTKYLIQSVLEPEAYIVAGYTNDMIKSFQPPVNLNSEEIKAVITYLQSQGGKVDTWEIDIVEKNLQTIPFFNPFQFGKADRGENVFKEFGCSKCHSVGNIGGGLGPDITAIGAYRNWTWFAESILDPNAEVGKNWTPISVELDWDDPVEGILRDDTDNSITVLVAKDEFVTISKNEIESMNINEKSNMPSDISEILTFQQMSDLINYLQSLKGEKN